MTLATFGRLQERLGARDVDLAECAAATVERTLAEWRRHSSILTQPRACRKPLIRASACAVRRS